MNYDYPAFVPDIPIKRKSPLVDPEQTIIPHIIKEIRIYTDKNGKQHLDKNNYYLANTKDYPEYSILIKMFMKEHNLNQYERKTK